MSCWRMFCKETISALFLSYLPLSKVGLINTSEQMDYLESVFIILVS
jgi:hypothetical protein